MSDDQSPGEISQGSGGGRRLQPEEFGAFAEPGTATPMDSLPADTRSELVHREIHERLELRGNYARWLLGVLIIQILVVHVVFLLYGFWNQWDVTGSIFVTYLATTLGETVGLATIVVRYLFPPPGSTR